MNFKNKQHFKNEINIQNSTIIATFANGYNTGVVSSRTSAVGNVEITV